MRTGLYGMTEGRHRNHGPSPALGDQVVENDVGLADPKPGLIGSPAAVKEKQDGPASIGVLFVAGWSIHVYTANRFDIWIVVKVSMYGSMRYLAYSKERRLFSMHYDYTRLADGKGIDRVCCLHAIDQKLIAKLPGTCRFDGNTPVLVVEAFQSIGLLSQEFATLELHLIGLGRPDTKGNRPVVVKYRRLETLKGWGADHTLLLGSEAVGLEAKQKDCCRNKHIIDTHREAFEIELRYGVGS